MRGLGLARAGVGLGYLWWPRTALAVCVWESQEASGQNFGFTQLAHVLSPALLSFPAQVTTRSQSSSMKSTSLTAPSWCLWLLRLATPAASLFLVFR